MSTVGWWVAADGGGSGTSVPDRSAFNNDGTLSGGCTWVTIAGEAAVRCPGSDSVSVAATVPHYEINPGTWTIFCRVSFYALSGRPGFFARSNDLAPSFVLNYTVASNKVSFQFDFGVDCLSDAEVFTTDTVYCIVARHNNQGGYVEFFIYDAAGVLLAGGTSPDGSLHRNAGSRLTQLGWGGDTPYDGDVAFIATRIENTILDDDTVMAIAADPALEGTVPTPPDPPEPGADGLLFHFVAAASGSTGVILPDLALGNDAFLQPLGQNTWDPVWQDMYSQCAGVAVDPLSGLLPGAVAPLIPAYDVTDFTMIVCTEFGNHAPNLFGGVLERLPVSINQASGSQVEPWWVFGIDDTVAGTKASFRHAEAGAAAVTITGDTWARRLVQRGTAAPDTGTMGGMYTIGLRRSGNDFTFFYKGAVFRSTGECIDPDTGAPAVPAPAALQGTATSSLVSGTVSVPPRIGESVDSNAFGIVQNVSYDAMWNRALTDDEILSIMDTAFPVCGTQLFPLQIDADLITSDEEVFQARIGTTAATAECSTFVEHVCLILSADWEFGRQVVPIYRNDLIFVNAAQQPVTFVNGNDELLSFNATGLMLSKSDVAGVYGHYLGWSARGEASPFRIETVEMEYQSTREWDTSP